MSTTSVQLVPQETSKFKTNLSYLVKGKGSLLRPSSFITRSSLNTLRYASKFIFWRLLRYLKYSLIAAGTTALAGTLIGTGLPLITAILVPSVPMAAAIGLATAVTRFSWRHRGNHFVGFNVHGDPKKDEEKDAAESEGRILA